MTRYVNFVHDEATYKSLDASRAWSDAYMIDRKDFAREISPYINPDLDIYTHALISNDCWQASPGKTIDTVRRIGIGLGGQVMEDTELIDVAKDGKTYLVYPFGVVILDVDERVVSDTWFTKRDGEQLTPTDIAVANQRL